MLNDADNVKRPATDAQPATDIQSWKPRPLFPTGAWSGSSGMEGAPRRPPRVVRMPAPEVKPAPLWLFGIVMAICLVAGGYASAQFVDATKPILAVSWGTVVILITLTVVDRRRVRRTNEARDQWMAKHAVELADPISQTVVELWTHNGCGFDLEKDAKHIEALSRTEQDRAIVIVVGELDIPEVGDFRFEPEILTGTTTIVVSTNSPILWLYPVLMTLYWVMWAWKPIWRGWLGCLILGAALLIPTRKWIRPLYYRLAPGMVQMLKYSWSNNQPEIRGYPLIGGTLAIVSRRNRRNRYWLQMHRGFNSDVLEIIQKRGAPAAVERMWQALLSTAPTPPLSDEELLG